MTMIIKLFSAATKMYSYSDPAFNQVFTTTMIVSAIAGIALSITAGFLVSKLLQTDMFGVACYKIGTAIGAINDSHPENEDL